MIDAPAEAGPGGSELGPAWRQRRERTAAHIERAALNLFTDRGYQSVTMEDVASAAGCSIRTVTRHFPTKEDLLLAFHRRKDQIILDEFARLEPTADPVPAIWGVWSALTTRAADDLNEYVQWMRVAATAPEVMDRANGASRRSIQGALTDFVARSLGLAPDSDAMPRVLAAVLESANAALVRYWVDRGGVDDLLALYESAAKGLSELTLTPRADGTSR